MTHLFGMGRIHRHIAEDATAAAAKGVSAASEARREVRELEEQLEKLTLVSMAMWSLLKDVTDLTEEDLMARVKELDLRDGSADGKVTKKVAECPKCGRVMSPRHKHCMYCGAEKLSLTAFDELK